MRTVALEEHFSVPAVATRIDKSVLARRGFRPRTMPKNEPSPLELLPEIGDGRLKSMNDAGISVQVLSNSGPGPDLVPGPDGVGMAKEINWQGVDANLTDLAAKIAESLVGDTPVLLDLAQTGLETWKAQDDANKKTSKPPAPGSADRATNGAP